MEKERDLIDERGTLWLLFLPSLIVVLTTLNMHHRADSLNDFFLLFFFKPIQVDFLLPQEK